MKYRWSIQTADDAARCQLTDALKISPLLARCLVNRGFANRCSQPRSFSNRDSKILLIHFCCRICAWRLTASSLLAHNNEPLVIFGDYDVDGVTSTALLVEVLTALGWKVHYYLPNRFRRRLWTERRSRRELSAKIPGQTAARG